MCVDIHVCCGWCFVCECGACGVWVVCVLVVLCVVLVVVCVCVVVARVCGVW